MSLYLASIGFIGNPGIIDKCDEENSIPSFINEGIIKSCPQNSQAQVNHLPKHNLPRNCPKD